VNGFQETASWQGIMGIKREEGAKGNGDREKLAPRENENSSPMCAFMIFL